MRISIAVRQISIYLNIPSSTVAATTAPAPRRSRPLFVTPKACHLSRYRESLPHKARQSRAGEGRWVKKPSNNFQLSVLNFPFSILLCAALRTKLRPRRYLRATVCAEFFRRNFFAAFGAKFSGSGNCSSALGANLGCSGSGCAHGGSRGGSRDGCSVRSGVLRLSGRLHSVRKNGPHLRARA